MNILARDGALLTFIIQRVSIKAPVSETLRHCVVQHTPGEHHTPNGGPKVFAKLVGGFPIKADIAMLRDSYVLGRPDNDGILRNTQALSPEL